MVRSRFTTRLSRCQLNCRIVIVGITPGRTQMANALKEAWLNSMLTRSSLKVLSAAKSTAAFSRCHAAESDCPARSRWSGRWLGSPPAARCSGLRRIWFKLRRRASKSGFPQRENYNGTPRTTRHPLLRAQLRAHFAPMVERMPGAGSRHSATRLPTHSVFLADEGVIDRCRILDGLPSVWSQFGADRLLPGRKSRADLSAKT